MASTKQNDVSKPGPPDVSRVQGLNLNHPKIESFSGISDENDRNSNLSPSKSADPSRKKMFKITSVKKGGGGTGDVGGDNDADSVDGLDESQTEDISSEFYDSSKATDLDMDLQDCMNIPLTPDEVTSTTTIVVKQKPDQNSQSRFKVVKIETKEPFRRGKWVCYDFFDTAPASVVMVEKNDSKATEDSVIQSALSGNLSLSSSVHYVQDVNDSSSNIFIPPVVSPARNDGQHMPSDAFVPIQPAPASQVLNQLDGLSSDIMAPFIDQQVLMSVAGVPSSSNSFHNLAQPGHTTIIQNLPHNNIFPYAQNGPPVGLYQNGVTTGQTSEVMSLPADAMIAAVGSGAPTLIATAAPAVGSSSIVHSQAFPIVSAVQVPHSLSQTQIAGDTIVSQGVPPVIETAPSTVLGPGIPSSMAHVPHSRTDTVAATTTLEVGEQMGPGMSESTDSIKTLQGDTDGQASEGLKEAVEAVGEMYMGLEGNEEDQDERTNEFAAMLSMLPLGGPNALPLHLDHRNLDSPFGYSLTPVRSLCASPVPISFLEHFDPVVSVTGMFPARVTTPTHAVFVPPSSAGFIEPVYNPPAIPAPTSFPHSESFVPPSYFPAPQPLVFSVTSAFVPMGISGASVVEPSSVIFSTAGSVSAPATMLKSGALVSMSQSMPGIPSLSTSHTAKMDRVSMMSSLSPDGSSRPVSPLMLVHPISTSSPVMENPGYATSNMPSMDDWGRAAGQNAGSICEYFDDSALPSDNQKPPEDDSGGGSTVAIDNKIEQAMDLVKRHLMYAVREEVEILKQQIGEMMERIGQLEYENTVLRSEARPETLNKLLQPRVVTSSQPTVPGQATPMLITPAPQQTPAQPPSQPQPSLQTTHPPPQQHLSQTTTAQAPQPPPSTSSS